MPLFISAGRKLLAGDGVLDLAWDRGYASVRMWETPEGPRKLQGRERAVFVEAILTFYDFLRDAEEGSHEVGIPVFDHLPIEERRYILLWVAEHVLGDTPAPPVRDWNAGTIAAIFVHLKTMIELEIEAEELEEKVASPYTWRRLVHEAWMEKCFPGMDISFSEGEGDRQSLSSRKMDEWEFKINCLEEEFIEDDDYALEELMDIPPDRASATKERMGIEDDYYREAPPVFTSAERARLLAYHRTLLAEESSA